MGDLDQIPVVVPVEATTPHNVSASTPADQFRDGQVVYPPVPPLPRKLVSNRVLLSDENIDMTDYSEPPDDIGVPHGDENNQRRTLPVYIFGVALGIAAVSVAISPLMIAITRRITQNLRQALVQALDLVLVPVTRTASSTLLSYSLRQMMRRPMYRLNPARVHHFTMTSTRSIFIRMINQHFSSSIHFLLLRR